MEANRFKEGLAELIAKEIHTLVFLVVTHKYIQAIKLPRLLLI